MSAWLDCGDLYICICCIFVYDRVAGDRGMTLTGRRAFLPPFPPSPVTCTLTLTHTSCTYSREYIAPQIPYTQCVMCIEWWVGSSLARECSIHRLPLLSPPSHAYWVPTSCFPIIIKRVVLLKMVVLYGEFSSFLARLVNRAASSHFFWWKQFLIRRQKQEGDKPLLGFKHKSRMDDICKVGICPPPLLACHLTSCLCNLSDACD